MKKNGFTLIELLAVIVILAIIALIATPVVLKLIEKARCGAAESDIYSYMKAVETSTVDYLLGNNSASLQGTYTINSDGSLTNDDKTVTLKPEIKGSKPKEGTTITLGDKQNNQK